MTSRVVARVLLSATVVKASTEKPAVAGKRRHYHLPPRETRDSWDSWVGDRRPLYRRLEWYFALLVVVAISGLILWRVA